MWREQTSPPAPLPIVGIRGGTNCPRSGGTSIIGLLGLPGPDGGLPIGEGPPHGRGLAAAGGGVANGGAPGEQALLRRGGARGALVGQEGGVEWQGQLADEVRE